MSSDASEKAKPKKDKPAKDKDKKKNKAKKASSTQSFQFIVNPQLNPFSTRRIRGSQGVAALALTNLEGYTEVSRSRIMTNLHLLCNDVTLLAGRERILNIITMCEVMVRIGNDILISFTSGGGGSGVSMRWVSGKEKEKEFIDIIKKIAGIIQVSKDRFLINAYDSRCASGLIVVQPSVRDELYGINVPLVRLWDDTIVLVRIQGSQNVYRVFQRAQFLEVAKIQERELTDAVVFDTLNYRPQVYDTGTVVCAPLGPVKKMNDFRDTMVEAAKMAALQNSVPMMTIEPIPDKTHPATQQPVLTIPFSDRTVRLTENEAEAMLKQELEAERVKMHNEAEVQSDALERVVPVGDRTQVLPINQYRLPLGYGSGKPVTVPPGRSDFQHIQAAHERAVGASIGMVSSMLYGEINQKTNTGELRRNVTENIEVLAAKLSTIYTYAINKILAVDMLKRREDAMDEAEKKGEKKPSVSAEEAATEDFVHVWIQLPKYDEADLDSLYAAEMLPPEDWRRLKMQFYGLSDGIQTPYKDPFDKDFRQEMLVKGSSKKRERENAPGKADKKAKKTTTKSTSST